MRERAQRFSSRQTMMRSGFEVFHYDDNKPDEVEFHNHDFYEVFFFLDGSISYSVEGEIYNLQPGDVLLISPLVLHRPVVLPERPRYERIVLWIDKSWLSKFCRDGVELDRCFGGSESRGFVLLRGISSHRRATLTEKLGNLVHECYSGDFGSELYAEGLFLQVMVELNRLALNFGGTAEVAEKGESSLISALVAYINENYSENLSLELLSQQFFVSKYHLSHEFSRVMGTGVYRYVMLKRLTVAKQLLSDGVPPGEVYLRCGFKDYAGFFRAFRQEYGISPKDFHEGK